MFIIFIMLSHFSIIWNRCFYPMSPQKTPPRPLLLDLRTSTNDEKVIVGIRHFSDLFADFPKGLPWFDDCWYLLIVDATALLLQLWNERIYSIINKYIYIYTCIYIYIYTCNYLYILCTGVMNIRLPLFSVFNRVPGLWPIPIWRFPKIGIRWN